MATTFAISRGRRLAGGALLVACGGGIAASAVHDGSWLLGGVAAALSVAGVGLCRRSILVQVLARGTAWALLLPAFAASGAALAGASALALLLARPMLHTPIARAEFAPVAYRRWLLAGAVGSVAGAATAAAIGLESLSWGPASVGAGLLVLAASLLASAVGVARMRAWGVLLGMVTSVALLVVAAFLHDANAVLAGALAVPGMMFALPVVRRGSAPRPGPARVRVVGPLSVSRVRVASELGSATLADPTAAETESVRPLRRAM
jgi:hypothetical protein